MIAPMAVEHRTNGRTVMGASTDDGYDATLLQAAGGHEIALCAFRFPAVAQYLPRNAAGVPVFRSG